MRHGSLFSGIGGFDIAAEWMGWENVFHCEWNDFGQKTLKYYWPNAKSYGDIKQTDFTIYQGQIDVLSGGFPCQPYSVSGKRLGKEDDRHLWPEMLRAIREIQPRWVVGENVRGIISWGGGLVFDEVQSDLEAEGYEVLPFLLPAVAVDAPHRRDRVWFVAYSKSNRNRRVLSRVESQNDCEREPEKHGKNNLQYWDNGKERNVTDTDSGRQSSQEHRKDKSRQFTEKSVSNYWADFPTQSPVCGIYDGISEWILRNIKSEIYATISKRYTDKDLQEMWSAIQSAEVQEQIRGLYKIHGEGVLYQTMQLCSPTCNIKKGVSVWSEKASEGIMRKLSKYGTITNTPQGRELEKQFTGKFADTLPFLSHEIALVAMETEKAAAKFKAWHRNESIKAYGNAVVPQVPFEIFKAIEKYDQSI